MSVSSTQNLGHNGGVGGWHQPALHVRPADYVRDAQFSGKQRWEVQAKTLLQMEAKR